MFARRPVAQVAADGTVTAIPQAPAARSTIIYESADHSDLLKIIGIVAVVALLVFGAWKIFDSSLGNQNYERCVSTLCQDIARGEMQLRIDTAQRPPTPFVFRDYTAPAPTAAPARILVAPPPAAAAPAPTGPTVMFGPRWTQVKACLEGLGLVYDTEFQSIQGGDGRAHVNLTDAAADKLRAANKFSEAQNCLRR